MQLKLQEITSSHFISSCSFPSLPLNMSCNPASPSHLLTGLITDKISPGYDVPYCSPQ